MIWDISTGGARLAAGRSKSLPATFTLITSKDGKSRYHCRVAWRNEGLLGVQFVQASEADEDLHAFSRGPVVPLKAASPRVRGLRGPTLKLAERRHRTTG